MKKRINKIYHFSIAFVLILSILLFSIPLSASNISSSSKISNRLLEIMASTSNAEISVSIWLQAPKINSFPEQSQKEIQKSVREQSDKYKEYRNLKKEYILETKKTYIKNNQKFANAFIEEENIIYVSKYSPMIIATLSCDEILKISKSKKVESIDYYNDSDFMPITTTESSYTPSPDMTSELSSYGYTGDGIYIGVIDTGVPLLSELNNNFSVGEMYGSYNGTHASSVGNTIHSIAPDATFYFIGNSGYTVTESIEWLVEHGVDVINMSLVVSSTLNSYTNYSKWFDHIAVQHAILFVSGAGNNMDSIYLDERGIHAESMAYNNIAVGAMKYENSSYTLCNFSSYYSGNGYASKPDVCALGPSGTSEAAPRVTGLAALLMEANSDLLYAPTTVKAIIMAAVNTNTPHHYVPTMRSPSGINYMQCGAGLISEENAISVAENLQFKYEIISSNSANKTYTFYISNENIGDTVRVSMAFLMPATALGIHSEGVASSSSYPINFDLKVYSPNSNSVCAISATTFNSVEIVEFTAQVSGYYTIEIVTNNNPMITEASVAWFIS